MRAVHKREIDFGRRVAQSGTPESLAAAFEVEAQRWLAINSSDPGVRLMRVAASSIRQLDSLYRTAARRVGILLAMNVDERRAARRAAIRAGGEATAAAARIAALEGELVSLRAENAALKAVAMRPVVEVQAKLQASDSRTRHVRDENGELVESLTEYQQSS